MFKRLKIKKRLRKTYERIKFKADNPSSRLYGHFKVKRIENNQEEIYNFANYKIIKKLNKKEIQFYENNVLQMVSFRFSTKFYNNIESLESTFNKTDVLTNNYTYLE